MANGTMSKLGVRFELPTS